MDPRNSISRTPSSNIQQSYNPNMASAYAMPPYPNSTHLPPINYPPPTNANYMQQQQQQQQQQYRNDGPRYNPAPSPVQTPDSRYGGQMTPQTPMSGLPPSSMLPQPHGQNAQPNYGNPSGQRSNYPQPLAPAPPRSAMDPFANNYGQPGDNRPAWSGAEQMPGMNADVGRDPNRTHVVGSQGRRGILPSAPGRPPVMNGMNGSPKGNAIPQKDADGKFPCPNCTKTYLHAKHLKRHMLRHTGDRPYMCVLCNDTFSRSDILKRHFQKCSVRRGNPTGASHLSNPAAHLKKSQAAAAKAAATASPASATTPSSTTGMQAASYTSTTMPGSSMPTTTASLPAVGTMAAYPMGANGQSDMQRAANHGMQGGHEQNNIDPNASNNWQMHNARNSQMMYQSNNAFAENDNDNKQNVMQNPHHVGDQWNQMPGFSGNEQYMNPIFSGYEQNQNDVKKEYGSHENNANGYYIPPTSLGADGTLDSPFWNFHLSPRDPLQSKVDQLVDFCFPLGIQESLQEPPNNPLRSILTVDHVQHFIQLYPNFQGHFPWLHMPTFRLLDAYDGLVLIIICSGAVYSDRVVQRHVRDLIRLVSYRIECTSNLWQRFITGTLSANALSSPADYEELQALLMSQNLMVWHGGIEERASARTQTPRAMQLVRLLKMLTLAPPDNYAYSYLHNLTSGETADTDRWQWSAWVEQEKRSRLMFMAFLSDAAMNLYFNCMPQFSPTEIKLPLPCDDAAWEAPDADSCARALGLNGAQAQAEINIVGSLRSKQLEMHHAVAALYDGNVVVQPRTTNVYGKFILIHAMHTDIWQLHRRRASSSPDPSRGPGHSPPFTMMAKAISTALGRWKQAWDVDMQLQYPAGSHPSFAPKRFGFCRDGIHFYWLARALLQPTRCRDWHLPAEIRFRQIMNGLRRAREWAQSDGARRGEEPGSVADIDDWYENEAPGLDMSKLFRPLSDSLHSLVDVGPTRSHGFV